MVPSWQMGREPAHNDVVCEDARGLRRRSWFFQILLLWLGAQQIEGEQASTPSTLLIWQDYPELLRLAADMIEPVVNASLAARERYPLEYAGEWRANFCGANRYDGASSG